MKIISSLLLCFAFAFTSCAQRNSTPEKKSVSEYALKGYSQAVFASGCFWATEGKFESVIGVKEAVSGYSGGFVKSPTYEAVCSEETGHAEAVKVYYDPKVVSYADLVKVYFSGIDPTQVNGQGPDHGSSYRSVIFYSNDAEKQIISQYMTQLTNSKKYKAPLAVEVAPLKQFWKAELYHQDYIYTHTDQSYIAAVSIPKIQKFQHEFPAMVKKGYAY